MVVIFLTIFALLAFATLGFVAIVLRFFFWLWQQTGSDQKLARGLIVIMTIAFVVSPYVAYKIYERAAVLARVPKPLEVATVEYRLEESWGIGGPGDNETGFVVYRLTASSAEWARSRGNNLGTMLAGGGEAKWHPTPVGANGDQEIWYPSNVDRSTRVDRSGGHLPVIDEFLVRYGFPISVEKGRDADANSAIQTSGSFYSYGRGGSVTIVDPKRGKVYFAYAG